MRQLEPAFRKATALLRVIIEVEEPSGGTRKLAIRPGQQLEFGSSEYANVAVRDDAAMSATHFRIHADHGACYLQDLASSNGTYINEQPAVTAVLCDGDRIRAGQTRFRVSIQGGDPPESAVPPPAATPPSPDRLRPRGEIRTSYDEETCNSGLTIYRGNTKELAPAALAAELNRAYPLYLLVDFSRLGQPDAAPQGSEYLINWLGDEVAAAMSPRFCAAAEVQEWSQYVEQGWEADAVVCVFASRGRQELLEDLRRAIRGGRGDKRGIIGYCWPSVLESILRSSKPATIQPLMSKIEAVLTEAVDNPEQWHLFGSPGLADVLQRVGLERNPRSPGTDELDARPASD